MLTVKAHDRKTKLENNTLVGRSQKEKTSSLRKNEATRFPKLHLKTELCCLMKKYRPEMGNLGMRIQQYIE